MRVQRSPKAPFHVLLENRRNLLVNIGSVNLGSKSFFWSLKKFNIIRVWPCKGAMARATQGSQAKGPEACWQSTESRHTSTFGDCARAQMVKSQLGPKSTPLR